MLYSDKIGFKCQNSSCDGYIKVEGAGHDIAVYKKQIKRQFDFWVKKYYTRKFGVMVVLIQQVVRINYLGEEYVYVKEENVLLHVMDFYKKQ